MEEYLGIHFSSDILAFALEKEKLTRTYYIAIFEADISIGDVFACPPFIWYKVVVRMVQQYQGNMLHTGCSGFLLLSQSLCGAKCLQDSLPHLPRELQQNLVHTYSDLTSYNQAVEHTTVLTTYSVLMVFLPLLDSARLRRLVFVLGPGLALPHLWVIPPSPS